MCLRASRGGEDNRNGVISSKLDQALPKKTSALGWVHEQWGAERCSGEVGRSEERKGHRERRRKMERLDRSVDGEVGEKRMRDGEVGEHRRRDGEVGEQRRRDGEVGEQRRRDGEVGEQRRRDGEVGEERRRDGEVGEQRRRDGEVGEKRRRDGEVGEKRRIEMGRLESRGG